MESKKHRNFASLSTEKPQGRLAQLVQSVCLTSRGSGVRIPQRPLLILLKATLGRLAQLVQSVCLTSRGSGVRIPQRPHKPSATRKAFFISPTDTPGHNQPPDHHRNQPPTHLTTTAYSPDHHRIAVGTHGLCVRPPDGPAAPRGRRPRNNEKTPGGAWGQMEPGAGWNLGPGSR